MASAAMPCDASTGAHAAAAPRPPLDPAKAIAAGNGPGPAGQANNPNTPASRTFVTVVPAASQHRRMDALAVRPAASTVRVALSGAGMPLSDGATTSPDHHRPNGSDPTYVPATLASRPVSTVPSWLAQYVPSACRVVRSISTHARTRTGDPGSQPLITTPRGSSTSTAPGGTAMCSALW